MGSDGIRIIRKTTQMNTAIRPGILRVLITLGVLLALATVVTTSNTPVHATNSGPDLVVVAPSIEHLNPYGPNPWAGSQMTLSVTVTNSGDEASEATWLRGYMSTDSTITTSDTEEGGQHVGALAAAGSSSFDHGLTAPSEAGTYYYGVCVDSVTGESDTTNNCSSSVMITVLEPAPDLVVKEIDTSNNIETGGSLRVSVKVTNLGDAQSAATTLRWMQLADGTGTTTEIGTDDVRALTHPQANHESIRLTAPSTPGTYRYWACVDSVAGESDTTNNCSSSVTVTVTRGGGGGGGGGGGTPPPTGPVFTDGTSTSRSVAVPVPDGADVGDPVAASHPDDLGITYSLVASIPVLFTVDEMTGQIRLVQGVSLVSGQTYTVTVKATDSAGMEVYIDVVIEIEPHRYDLNSNGAFEKEEVIEAINDYLFGTGDEQLTKAEVIEIITLYLFG